jgi:hypothetical protein
VLGLHPGQGGRVGVEVDVAIVDVESPQAIAGDGRVLARGDPVDDERGFRRG